MRTLRTLLRKNCWTSGALLIALLTLIGGGPTLLAAVEIAVSPIQCGANSIPDAADGTSDQEGDHPVLSSLEAVVVPVAKLQMALLVGFVPPRVMPEITAPVRIALLVPPNNYLRTLFRLITPANAP